MNTVLEVFLVAYLVGNEVHGSAIGIDNFVSRPLSLMGTAAPQHSFLDTVLSHQSE